ncbi:MAG: hypothetical protein GY749_06190 [Desulfobacteraceae bacterium]|nr:hypothetical protein [Desulfobacteraceae bacterium]
MQAFEFMTKINNGMIKVPEISGLKPEHEVKVILLVNLTEPEDCEKADQNFQAVKIKTKGFRFNREEAHERQNIY